MLHQKTCSQWRSGAVRGRRGSCLVSRPASASPAIRRVVADASGTAPAGPLDSSGSAPYPFHRAQYHQMELMPAPYGPIQLYSDVKSSLSQGLLVFRRAGISPAAGPAQEVMTLYVSGDTALSTWSLLSGRPMARPPTHDLLWQVCQQASRWSFMHAAVVESRDGVLMGRLFFGDLATGEVMWDCDCKPSDGIYLALKAGRPFYVHEKVWSAVSHPLRNSQAYRLAHPEPKSQGRGQGQGQAPGHASSAGHSSHSSHSSGHGESRGHNSASSPHRPGQGGHQRSSEKGHADSLVEDFTKPRPEDPDAIKLLKRQLQLAVAEQDYAGAARVRDHTWMQLHRRAHVARLLGRVEEAWRAEEELRMRIEAAEASVGSVNASHGP